MDKETIQEITKVVNSSLSYSMKRSAIHSILEERDQKMPTRKKARWIEVDNNMYTCSNCSYCFTIVPEDNHISQFNYCPNCSTKMEVE